jgi:catechol 2,3-dioxygenase-like lactoylglutathione lyase family enzyme
MSAITHLFAGVPVSDLDASIDWYTRFFGRSPDMRAGDEILWDVDEHATLLLVRYLAALGINVDDPDVYGSTAALFESRADYHSRSMTIDEARSQYAGTDAPSARR